MGHFFNSPILPSQRRQLGLRLFSILPATCFTHFASFCTNLYSITTASPNTMLGNRSFPAGKPLLNFNCFRVLCLIYLQALFSTEATGDSGAATSDGMTTRYGERIIGGAIPPEGKYPSLVRISEILKNGTLFPICAGTILNRDWILTAAQCFFTLRAKHYNISRYRIIVGDSLLNETEPYEQTVRVERFIVPEKLMAQNFYNHTQFLYDIAVVKVVPPIKFSNRVTAVNLPTCGEYELGTGWVPGWGGNANVTRITEFQTPTVTNEECNKWLKTLRPYYEITELITCARQVNMSGFCFEDYGAPLFLIKNESYMVQVGIASIRPKFDTFCGREGHLTLYTRVSEYLGWIHRRISGCGNHPFHPVTEVDDYNDKNDNGPKEQNRHRAVP